METPRHYGRFYTLLNKIPFDGDREELKRNLVRQYTWERTDSLREMSAEEYDGCCAALEKLTGYKDELKKSRSATLRLMQKMGIDTTDWSRVNSFSEHPRIMGKPFARLTIDEQKALRRKLRAIESAGGLRPPREQQSNNAKISILCVPTFQRPMSQA